MNLLGTEQGAELGFGIESELILSPHLVCSALFQVLEFQWQVKLAYSCSL